MEKNASVVLKSVIKALDAGCNEAAVNAFVAALSHESALRSADIPSWLAPQMGKDRAQKLIRAFARHACMGCRAGLILCEECGGKGHFSHERPCEKCVGLGAQNCDFCSGSGWITYNYVPAGMRVAVILERSRLVLAEVKTLLKTALPVVTGRNGASTRKEIGQQILRANRYLGAFSNAIGVAESESMGELHAAGALPKIKSVCVTAAARLDRRIRALLSALAKLSRLELERGRGSSQQELAQKRAEFYQHLVDSERFVGTSLYHVHLAAPSRRKRQNSKKPKRRGNLRRRSRLRR